MGWWTRRDLNTWSPPYQGGALPTKLLVLAPRRSIDLLIAVRQTAVIASSLTGLAGLLRFERRSSVLETEMLTITL